MAHRGIIQTNHPNIRIGTGNKKFKGNSRAAVSLLVQLAAWK
jgi:hypothetical protein